MVKDMLLTTVDNPFNPFTHFDEWKRWDEDHGYYTCGLLAREAKLSDELSDVDQALEINRAINFIVKENVSGMHRKIFE